MALLSRVLDYDFEGGTLSAEVEVAESDLFFDAERGGVPCWVGFEYMAQSIAALSGLKRQLELEEQPRIGYIMGVRDYRSRVPAFAAGSRLRVEVREVFRDGEVLSFQCAIRENGVEQVRGIINAIEPEEGLPEVRGDSRG